MAAYVVHDHVMFSDQGRGWAWDDIIAAQAVSRAQMTVKFTVHNIELDDGTFTKPEGGLDKPREFLEILAKATTRVLILDTHFAEARDSPSLIQPRRLRRLVAKVVPLDHNATTTHKLSYLTEHEGLRGRWYSEYPSNRAFRDRENRRLASWDNRRSFWVQREHLIGAIRSAGFDLVPEQFDQFGSDIADEMTKGTYRIHGRGTFIGIKSAN
jgi:hypothetical protein